MRGRQLIVAALLVIAGVAGAAWALQASRPGLDARVDRVVHDRLVIGYLAAPVLAPPESVGGSPTSLLAAARATALVLSADGVDETERSRWIEILEDRALAYRPGDEAPSSDVLVYVEALSAFDLADERGDAALRLWGLLSEALASRPPVETADSLLDLAGLQFTEPPTDFVVPPALRAGAGLLCESARGKTDLTVEPPFAGEVLVAEQVSAWMGEPCLVPLSRAELVQGRRAFDADVDRLVAIEFPSTAGGFGPADAWLVQRGLMSPDRLPVLRAWAEAEHVVLHQEPYVGQIGLLAQNVTRSRAQLELELTDADVTVLERYLVEPAIVLPSPSPGEIFLLAEVRSMVGQDPMEGVDVAGLDADQRWLLAAATSGLVPPLQPDELDDVSDAATSGAGFTAGIAALRYALADWVPEAERCRHALAVDLSGTEQITWVVERLGVLCPDLDSEGLRPFVAGAGATTKDLAWANEILDWCLGDRRAPRPEARPSTTADEDLRRMYVDELWSTLVAERTEPSDCGEGALGVVLP